MSKTVSPALKAHYALGSTTLVRCWKVTRQDGTVFGFTTHDRSFPYLGTTYESPTGLLPMAHAASADLSVQNSEISGIQSFASVTEDDVLGGVWDYARVEEFELNIEDLSMGVMVLEIGDTGDMSTGVQEFRAELRGQTQGMQQTVGRTYSSPCDTEFGHPTRCQVDLAPLKVTSTVTAVTNRGVFTDATRFEASDYFGAGVVRWLTGANAGHSMEVRLFAGGLFTLHQSMFKDITIGDSYEATPGCRKRMLLDCKTKWNNIVNFQGFDLPMNDSIIGNGGLPG